MKKKIAIGLDLGTTSVGWSIIEINNKNENQKLKILDMGVRLFNDPASNDSNVKTRRIARGRRRRIHREKIRKNDLFKLVKKYKLVNDKNEFDSFIKTSFYDDIEETYKMPVEIKIKGLTNQLTKHELILILHNYIKHRGILNTIDSDDENDQIEKDENLLDLYDKNKYPSENQLIWFNTTGKILGNKGNCLINNEDWIKEIELILSNQKALKIDNNFIYEFIKLFKRHRHYSEGPGSENSPTKYGRFKLDIKTGNLIWQGEKSKLWDLLIGKCTYYPEEPRNYKKSPITEIFNLMNDFANLRLKHDNTYQTSKLIKLTAKEKLNILSQSHNKLTLDKILKFLNLTKNNIDGGIKQDQNNKWKIESLTSTKKIVKWLVQNNLKNSVDLGNLEDLNILDRIFELGVCTQNSKEREKYFLENKVEFEKLNLNCNEEQLKELANFKIFYSGTSSLSKKAQLEFIEYAKKDSVGNNQMVYFEEEFEHKNGLDKFGKFNKYFPENFFADKIMSSTVKRALNQTIKILNAILKNKKYRDYKLTHIIIEVARELNSEFEKKAIELELKRNKQKLSKLMKEHGLSSESDDDSTTESELLKKGENKLKFLLWCQQNKQDIYDGNYISLSDLLSNNNKYHIDHVLPISISFIDSMQNKVLTKAELNEFKGNLTPYQWLSKNGKYEEYQTRCWKLLDEIQDKKEKSKLKNKIEKYLLYIQDPKENLPGFVERQLNDTRYISKEISNQLKLFFKQSKYWKNKDKVIIHSVNGSLTAFARKGLFNEEEFDQKFLIKNRNIYNHHAIDASIIAYLGLNNNIQNLLKLKSKDLIKKEINGIVQFVDYKTGETFKTESELFEKEAKICKYFRDEMRDFINPEIRSKFVRFSRMICSKNNGPLSNETLYGIKKIKGLHYGISNLNLLNKEKKDLEKYFGNDAKDKKKLLIYLNDTKLYEKLNKIFNDSKYNDSKISPFKKYLNDEFCFSKIKEIESKEINNQILDKFPIFSDNLTKITHWIKKIKVISNEIKDKSDYLILKNHNNKAFFDSLKPFEIWIYKTNDNKFQTLFINALNIVWNAKRQILIPDENKIKKQLNNSNINFKYDPIKIKKGQCFIKNNDLFYVVGGVRKNQTIEIKTLKCKNELASKFTNWKYAPNRNRWQIAISSIVKEFKLCKIDILGNVYDIQTFNEYFEKNII